MEKMVCVKLLPIKLAITLAIIGFGIIAHAEDDYLKAERLCYEIERNINAQVDFTTTKCLLGPGLQKGSISFILISKEPILSLRKSKKTRQYWLIAVVRAVGMAMWDNPKIKMGDVYVTDTNLMEKHKALCFSGELAKVLQRKAFNGEINLDQLYLELRRATKWVDIFS
jgi:hypothetical protein